MRWNRTAALVILLPAILASSTLVSAESARPTGAPSAVTNAAVRPGATASTKVVRSAASVWRNVVTDRFNGKTVPGHWFQYNGPYGSGPRNCASPKNVYTKNGSLRLRMRYMSSGNCGAGWYTGGLMIDRKYGGVDQRITLRFKVVRNGAASHYIIPMRWPDTVAWPAGGEEDYCETNTTRNCSTFLHYSSSNKQIDHITTFNMAKWHVLRVQRYHHVVKIFVDDMSKPRWTYSGSSTTLPDTVKRVVLQQECQSSCPSGKSGYEVIKIDWIKIDTAS